MTEQAQDENTSDRIMRFHFRVELDDGTLVEDTRDRGEMLEFNFSKEEQNLLPAFRAAIVDMSPGDQKEFRIEAQEAYGEHIPQAVVEVPRSAFPEDGFEPGLGMTVQGTNDMGQNIQAQIVSFDENKITLDHNHPLAGKDLNFQVEVEDVYFTGPSPQM